MAARMDKGAAAYQPRGSAGQGAPSEPDPPIREALIPVVGVVDPAMIARAEQDHVREVGEAAFGPRFQVMGLGPGGGCVAVLGLATLIS